MSAFIDTLAAWDSEAFLAVNSCHSEAVDQFMYLVSDKWVWVPLYFVIFLMLVRRYGWLYGLIAAIGAGLAVALADQTCATLIRPFCERLRPANPDNPIAPLVHIVNGYRGGPYGFPSCHAANTAAFAVYIVCCFPRRRGVVAFLVAWVVLNCGSRMYLGVHYPGDLLLGLSIGALLGLGVYLALSTGWRVASRRHHRRVQDNSRIDMSLLFTDGTAVADTTVVYLIGCLITLILLVVSLGIYYF